MTREQKEALIPMTLLKNFVIIGIGSVELRGGQAKGTQSINERC